MIVLKKSFGFGEEFWVDIGQVDASLQVRLTRVTGCFWPWKAGFATKAIVILWTKNLTTLNQSSIAKNSSSADNPNEPRAIDLATSAKSRLLTTPLSPP